jgi:hypothetical protein
MICLNRPSGLFPIDDAKVQRGRHSIRLGVVSIHINPFVVGYK